MHMFRSFFATLLPLIVVAILASGIAGSQTTGAPQSPLEHTASAALTDNETYRVVRVVDGDTLVVDMNGVNTTLRLIGLDTPETVDPRKTVQCFGKEASDKAKSLLAGTSVRVEYDASQGTLDKYGRTLAYIYMNDGELFNRYMIAEGYGHEYTYAVPYAHQAEFKAAEQSAREGKKGLWADGACERAAAPKP